MPALFILGTLGYPGSCSAISSHFLLGSFACCPSCPPALVPTPPSSSLLLPPPPPRHRQRPAQGVSLSLLSPQSAPELWQWLWALRRATSANRDMLPSCHPGTFRARRWTCCLQPTRAGRSGGPVGSGCPEGGVGVPVSPLLSLAAPGCSRTHGTVVLGQWSDLGDTAVAAQSLYGHLR